MHRKSPEERPGIRNVLKTAGSFLFTFFIAAIVMTAVFLVAAKLFGWHLFSVDSASMAPQYPVDALVVVRRVEPETIRSGDVITFVLNEEGVLATHRVTRVNSADQTFTTKGDANDREDAAPVRWENVVGKAVFGIPWLGKPMRFLSAAETRPFLIAALAVLFGASLIWDIVLGRKNRRRSKCGKRWLKNGKENTFER